MLVLILKFRCVTKQIFHISSENDTLKTENYTWSEKLTPLLFTAIYQLPKFVADIFQIFSIEKVTRNKTEKKRICQLKFKMWAYENNL